MLVCGRSAKGSHCVGGLLVLLCSHAVVPDAAAECLSLSSAAELPRLGGIQGEWLGPDEFVLVDIKGARLLTYTVGGASETVWPPSGQSWLGPLSVEHTLELELDAVVAAEDGLILAVYELKAGSGGAKAFSAASLVRLDSALRPTSLLDWDWPAPGQPEGRSSPLTFVNELVAVGATLFAWGGHMDQLPRPTLFALGGNSGSGGSGPDNRRQGLREEARWPLLEGEGQYQGSLPIRSLAAGSNERAGFAYALRMAPTPFIQILTPAESGPLQRLTSFPESASSLPDLPPRRGWDTVHAFFTAAEAASYPAGLYGQGGRLYVLAREFVDGAPFWDLHHIDPVKDRIVGRTRLPTNAAYVSLLPGEKYWVLEESSSFVVDLFRQPIRLLLLDSEAVRAGGELRCD